MYFCSRSNNEMSSGLHFFYSQFGFTRQVPFFIYREQKCKGRVATVSLFGWLMASEALVPLTSTSHRAQLVLHIHHRAKD